MGFKKILVAYDDSETAEKALAAAADIARPNLETHVDIVYVAPIPLLSDTQAANLQSITDMMIDDGKKILQDAFDSVEDLDGRVKTLLLTAVSPATELLKLIDTDSYDMVVIGSRGLSGLKEYMGSVSHKVLHGSKVPVLVVK